MMKVSTLTTLSVNKKCKQKGSALILVLVGILVIVAVAGGAYYFGKSQVPKPQPSVAPQQTVPPQVTASDETSDWKTYKNVEYNYEILYPNNWDVIEASADGTQTMFGRKLDKDELQKVTFTRTFDIGAPPSVVALVQIAVNSNSSNLTLSQIASKNYPRTNISDSIFGEKKAKLIHPVCCNYPEFGYILIQNNKYLYTITFPDISPNDSDTNYSQAKNTDDQILSTFKFTP